MHVSSFRKPNDTVTPVTTPKLKDTGGLVEGSGMLRLMR